MKRPLVAVVLGSALVAGSSLVAGPAFAGPDDSNTRHPAATAELDNPAPNPDDVVDPPIDPPIDPPVDPAPDTVAPVGTFTLNTAALWTGQSTTLSQGVVSDDTNTPEQITGW